MKTEQAPAPVVAKRASAKRVATPKVHPPHEHFGSPLNICRVCGEKYTYTQKPYSVLGLSNSER